MIHKYLSELLDYGLEKEMITSEDTCYVANRILQLVEEASFERVEYTPHDNLEAILEGLLDIADKNGKFELDLILRNNRTTEEHLLGIFHPHSEYHHIKKENIGLIEARGLAVLPARLKTQFGELTDEKKEEIGQIFAKILENCGVYKNTEVGNNGFKKFVSVVNS